MYSEPALEKVRPPIKYQIDWTSDKSSRNSKVITISDVTLASGDVKNSKAHKLSILN